MAKRILTGAEVENYQRAAIKVDVVQQQITTMKRQIEGLEDSIVDSEMILERAKKMKADVVKELGGVPVQVKIGEPGKGVGGKDGPLRTQWVVGENEIMPGKKTKK